MMGKVFPPGNSFSRVCQYVAQDQKRSLVLDTGGVRSHDHRLMARDFEIIHSLQETRRKAVFHSMIDFHPKESVDDRKMVEIAHKYLAQIGLGNTQYAVVRHLDKDHNHMHIVANRIGYEGRYIDLYPEILRSYNIVRGLVKEYDMIPVGRKNLRETNFDTLSNAEIKKYAIFRAVTECLPGCRDFEELQQRLTQQDVEVRYRNDPDTGQKIGLSFR